MVYDLLNPIELQQFKTKADFFVEKAKKKADERTLDKMLVVELKEKHPQRTIQQNRYLWVTITYVAIEEGYPKDNVEQFFKEVNRDIFLREIPFSIRPYSESGVSRLICPEPSLYPFGTMAVREGSCGRTVCPKAEAHL